MIHNLEIISRFGTDAGVFTLKDPLPDSIMATHYIKYPIKARVIMLNEALFPDCWLKEMHLLYGRIPVAIICRTKKSKTHAFHRTVTWVKEMHLTEIEDKAPCS